MQKRVKYAYAAKRGTTEGIEPMDAYIARQPIFNKNKKIYGYELLFRSSATDKSFGGAQVDQATSHVVMESFFSRGIDSITGGRPAFINFTSRLLLENTATLFPKDKLVVEILETVEPTPEIIEACEVLEKEGYRLALDDFIFSVDREPLIALSKIIKLDFLAHSPQEIASMLKKMNHKDKWLLAEKVETPEMFNTAVDMGFSLFQGFFFSKPEVLKSKVLSPLKFSYISLLREVSAGDEINLRRVSKTIREDIALSYKLLRLVNSSYYALNDEVTDISRAISIIGLVELRKWMFMVALLGLNTGKPDEIVRMSMIRGKFIEMLNTVCKRTKSNEVAFQAGLFSMLDVLMDTPMQSALHGINIADEVVAALSHYTGPLFDLLELVISLERSEWDKTDELAGKLGLSAEEITDIYLDAVKWSNDFSM